MKFRLKDFRETQKLFQSEMATILEINQSSVSRMELKKNADLTYPQYLTLCERFGKEEVERFAVEAEDNAIVVSGNTNESGGSQNNSVMVDNTKALEIIREQNKTISEMLKKQSEQTDKLMLLIDKISDKI